VIADRHLEGHTQQAQSSTRGELSVIGQSEHRLLFCAPEAVIRAVNDLRK
jgi:hypothetical protein